MIGLGAAPNGFYSSGVLWLDTSPWATVRGIEWTGTMNGPTAFTAYGAVTVPLVAGIDPTASPTLEPIANGSVSIAIEASIPERAEVHLWAEWPEGGVTQLAKFWGGTSHMTVPTPDVPGVAFTAVVVDAEYAETSSGFTSGWRRGLAANAAPEPIGLPTAAVFTAPTAESLVDLTTDFTYTAVPGAVYLVAFESGAMADPQYYVMTRATTARIPDLAWAGVPALRFGYTSFRTASVTAVGPFASVDAAAAGPASVMPDHWAWGQPFADNLPAADGFATRHRMYIRVW